MKERPILFSTPMVKAILDGRKTVTRRVVDPQPHNDEDGIRFPWATFFNSGNVFTWDDDGIGGENWQANDYPNENKYEQALRRTQHSKPCRHGKAGDILWVRETWAKYVVPDCVGGVSVKYRYKADDKGECCQWKPSIHMPKFACRLKLEIVSIRPERLHDITEEDAKLEGVPAQRLVWMAHPLKPKTKPKWQAGMMDCSHKEAFQYLWYDINGQESWDSNPWVWVINFRKL